MIIIMLHYGVIHHKDGVNAIYNKAPEIRITSNEVLTAYAGDIINYTQNIQVVDDRDNPTGNHVIDNSNIKVTIVSKETNSGGTQPDSNGSASGSGNSNTEGNENSSSSENTENQEQTTEDEEVLINDELSSGTTDSSEGDDQNENGGSSKEE